MKQTKTIIKAAGAVKSLSVIMLTIAMAISMIVLQTLPADAASEDAVIKLNYTSYKLIGTTRAIDSKAVTSVQLKAAVQDENLLKDANVSWKSSNSKVAKVNQYGYVKAVGDGTARITASIKNYKAVCKITVIMNPTYSTKDKEALNKIQKQQLKLGGNIVNFGIVEWTLVGKEYRITKIDWNYSVYDVSRSGYKPMIGNISFAGLPELRILFLKSSNLTGLDVSKNTKLTILDCSGNKLSKLDLSKNKKLESLYCRYNNIKSLDVSKNKALKMLDCGSNEMTSLNINGVSKLVEINCVANKLQGCLDVSGAPELQELNCSNNNLESVKYVSEGLIIYSDQDVQHYLIEENSNSQ